MNLQEQIDQAKAELKRLQEAQATCKHEFGHPYRDTENTVELDYENRPMGSDYFNPVVVGSHPVSKPVWRRKCNHCGMIQTTDKTEAVYTHHQPKFD
jgi:ribosomal protein L11 methylase PrmA